MTETERIRKLIEDLEDEGNPTIAYVIDKIYAPKIRALEKRNRELEDTLEAVIRRRVA